MNGACPYCNQNLLAMVKPSKPVQLVGCRNCINIALIEWTGEEANAKPIRGMPPLSEIAPQGSVMAGVFAMLNDIIVQLPVPPEVPQRLVSMVHDPLTSMNELAGVIEDDAAISMKVLRMANSALFSSTHDISDLRTACARLGMKVIANVAHVMSSSNLYRSGDPHFRELMQQLWLHSLATAHCSEELVRILKLPNTNSQFVAGLVHDIGKLVLLDALTVKYKGNTGRLKESPELLLKVMNRFSPIVGLHVVQYWKMAPEVLFTTFFNHQPEATPTPEWVPLAHVIALSSDLADAYGYRIGDGPPPDLSDHPSAKALELTREQTTELSQSLPEALGSIVDALGAI